MSESISYSKPIGAQLRRKQENEAKNKNSGDAKKVTILSIDEQILRLQSSIGKRTNGNEENESDDTGDSDSESESESGSNSDSDKEGNSRSGYNACRVERDSSGQIVRIVSSMEERERIKPLPKECLPAVRCSSGSSYVSYVEGGAERGSGGGHVKKKIRFFEEVPKTAEEIALSGMEKTIREMLTTYEPVSQDRKPFYCRVCKHQCNSLEDFEAHKLSEFHSVAVNVERKHRYCKHCEKEFTSPDQLKGHMEGKAHKEQVNRLASRKRFNYNAPH